MKYYIIAGEASGDLHASNLIKGLKEEDPQAVVRGWGGDLMQQAGCEIVRHYKDTAIMGFLTVLKNLGKIQTNIRLCSEDVVCWKPDVLILVDYAGFNLRIARFAKEAGIRVFYYISPKLWAWNTGRVKKIKKYVDRMYVIFPFETDFYKKYGYKAEYEGNPLVDAVYGRSFQEETFEQFVTANRLSSKPIVALLAGSRSQEIKHVLPKMLEMTECFPDYQFVIAGAPSMAGADYAPYLNGNEVAVVYGQTYRLLQQSVAALVTSGTATLETAILKVPQAVCYSGEGGALSYFLFKAFVKVKYISLVNLIMGREVVKELLMQKLNCRNLRAELTALLEQSGKRARMLADYEEINCRLGAPGASRRFAARMVEELRAKQ